MKTILSITVIALLSGCSQNKLYDKNEDKTFTENIYRELNKSYETWLDLKNDHHGTYSYERDTAFKEGFNNSTKLVIENDQVEHRYFFEWQTGNTPSLTWSEAYAELGRHNQGAPVRTIDELYQQCTNEILNKPDANYNTLFKTDTLGILKQCSYTLKQCTNDCTHGIKINGLTMY